MVMFPPITGHFDINIENTILQDLTTYDLISVNSLGLNIRPQNKHNSISWSSDTWVIFVYTRVHMCR